MKLQGKTAIVTESGSGIGKETAKVLAPERAKVSVVGWEVFDLARTPPNRIQRSYSTVSAQQYK
jgi:NAD(P)-dependent dehydrogenase (short-subunit alcohol dehydrogenase family)